jgi:hypothetical protein
LVPIVVGIELKARYCLANKTSKARAFVIK